MAALSDQRRVHSVTDVCADARRRRAGAEPAYQRHCGLLCGHGAGPGRKAAAPPGAPGVVCAGLPAVFAAARADAHPAALPHDLVNVDRAVFGVHAGGHLPARHEAEQKGAGRYRDSGHAGCVVAQRVRLLSGRHPGAAGAALRPQAAAPAGGGRGDGAGAGGVFRLLPLQQRADGRGVAVQDDRTVLSDGGTGTGRRPRGGRRGAGRH